mgnify:CR=1 FL=1
MADTRGVNSIKAGMLNRKIQFIRQSKTNRDSFGAPSASWEVVLTVRAHRVQQRAWEVFQAGTDRDGQITIWLMRYSATPQLSDKVRYAGKDYKIIGFQEIGTKKGLQVITEYVA